MTQWIDAVPERALAPGKSCVVETPHTRVAVINLQGVLHAIEDVCTHDQSPLLDCGLDAADLIDGDQIICPRHGARFCIRTGAALTPPAYEPIATYPVRIENGVIQVGTEPLPAGTP